MSDQPPKTEDEVTAAIHEAMTKAAAAKTRRQRRRPESKPAHPIAPPLLTVAEVARRLSVSVRFAYTLASSEIGCIRMGRSIRVRMEDLERYIERATSGATTSEAVRSSQSKRPPTRPAARKDAAPPASLIKPTYPRTKPRDSKPAK